MPCINVDACRNDASLQSPCSSGGAGPPKVLLSVEAKAEAVWFVLDSRRVFTILDTAKLELPKCLC